MSMDVEIRLTCKEKMSTAILKNPGYVPKPGDQIFVDNIYLWDKTTKCREFKARLVYRVSKKDPYLVTYDAEANATAITVPVIYVGEVSQSDLDRRKKKTNPKNKPKKQ